MKNWLIMCTLIGVGFLLGCAPKEAVEDSLSYFQYEDEKVKKEGGIRMIPIQTPKGEFKVWTKQVGNNPTIKVLLLHGGPGMTHETFMSFDGYLPEAGVEYYYYDQLGSHYSDQPSDSTLWTVDRFVDEVEQVRQALGLNPDNFFLYGQSWGGMLAMEYALAHQDKLKGLIISNMMASLPEYAKYAQEVLGPQMPPEVYEEVMKMERSMDFDNPRYGELLIQHYYPKHVLRKPIELWPEAFNRALNHVNPDVYVRMQGFSEFGITPGATLLGWDRSQDIHKITVPTLVVGSAFDTMDPKYMEWMSEEIPNARYLFCPSGSHMVQYDDPEAFFPGLISFLKDVDRGEF